jgi:uncharacterized protein YqeY
MALIDQLQKDIVVSMRAKDEARLSAIRMIKAALMKEKADSPKGVDEAAELRILNMLVKQRRDAADMYRQGGRPEQADKEEAELRLIETYMPAAASEDEIDAAIAAAIAETGATTAKQMGQVMNAAKARLSGRRIDGKSMSDKVKARLA